MKIVVKKVKKPPGGRGAFLSPGDFSLPDKKNFLLDSHGHDQTKEVTLLNAQRITSIFQG